MFEELAAQYGFTDEEISGFYDHFRIIDTGLDGHITHDDMRIQFKSMGIRVSARTINDLIKEVDVNGNGQVEFEEFVRLMFRLKKGGTSNWTQLLDYTRPKAKHLVKKAANATLRYFGAVPAFEFSSNDEWQNYSYFDRKDVKKKKDVGISRGKGKGKDIELKNVKIGDDEEADVVESDSSFEFYSDSDEENNRVGHLNPNFRNSRYSGAGPSNSQNLPPPRRGSQQQEGHVRQSSQGHVRQSSQGHVRQSSQGHAREVSQGHARENSNGNNRISTHAEAMSRMQAKLDKEEQMIKRISRTEGEMVHPPNQRQSSKPKLALDINLGVSHSNHSPHSPHANHPQSPSSPVSGSPHKSSPLEEKVQMRYPKQYPRDHRPLSSDFVEVNAQQRSSLLEQQNELSHWEKKRREEEESLKVALNFQEEGSWSVVEVGRPGSTAPLVPLMPIAPIQHEEPKPVRNTQYPIAQSFGDITAEVNAQASRDIAQPQVMSQGYELTEDQLFQLQSPDRRPRPNRDPSTRKIKKEKQQPQRRNKTFRSETLKKRKNYDAVLQDPKVRHQLAQLTVYKPYFTSLIVLIEIVVMAYMLIVNKGFESFTVNPLGGPTSLLVIQTGALYVPCMREATASTLIKYDIQQASEPISCPYGYEGNYMNTTGVCSYYDVQEWICGMGGFGDSFPNQWWRFITASFVHVGVIHLGIVVFFQFWFVFNLERDIGSIRMFFMFILSSVLGYAFAGNMSPLQLGAGASPSLFAFMSILYIDLWQNWPLIEKPWKHLFFMVLGTLIALAIGLLPYVDNYAHLGGFVGGILTGLIFLPTITFDKWDGRTKKILLVISLIVLIGLYVGAFVPFYDKKETDFCPYCEYLNCVPPGASWCDLTF